jgi:hypothetical protein
MVPERLDAEPNSPPWPPQLDACTAAPAYHAILFENAHVRVLLTHIPPGHTVPLHTHCWPGVQFFESWSPLVRRDPQGNVTLDTRTLAEAPKLNTPLWLETLTPHTVENVGDREIISVQVEIKSAK